MKEGRKKGIPNCESPEYRTWNGMKNRCYNLKKSSYKYYGAKGIEVCDRWLNSFENFYLDMGPKPEGYSIGRLNNSLSYSPQNCRWESIADQNRNKSNVKFYEHNGKKLIASELAKEVNLPLSCLLQRLRVWPFEKAISEPVNSEKVKFRKRDALGRFDKTEIWSRGRNETD